MQVVIDELMQIAEINDIKYFGVAIVLILGILIFWRLSK